MRPEPQLGPRTAVRDDAEEPGDELPVAPGVVLNGAADRLHRPEPNDRGNRTTRADVQPVVNNPRRLYLLVPAVAAGLMLAACGEESPAANTGSPPVSSAPPDTPPASTPPSSEPTTPPSTSPGADGYDHPTGADDVVIQISYEGGLVPAGVGFTQVPALLITGDGRVITEGPVPAIYPGQLLPNLVQRTITEAGIQTLLAKADELGLLANVRYTNPHSQIADAPDTVVTITVDGTTYRHVAYALGFDPESDPARASLFDFVTAATDLTGTVGADQLGAEEPYESDTYLIQATEVDLSTMDTDLPPTVVRWPADASVRLADAAECAELPRAEGDPLFTDANQLTFFKQAGVTYSVAATLQLPGRSC